MEQLDPDPYMDMLNKQGLPWQVQGVGQRRWRSEIPPRKRGGEPPQVVERHVQHAATPLSVLRTATPLKGRIKGAIMETRAGDPGAFAHFDLTRVDSPAFVVDAARLRANLAVLADIQGRAGIKVLAAMKAFSMWRVAPVIGQYLDGVCTSGLWEARLAAEHYSGEVATYCAAYKAQDLPEILRLSDHVIFNTPGQHARFVPELKAAREAGEAFDIGLRINPLHAEGEVPRL